MFVFHNTVDIAVIHKRNGRTAREIPMSLLDRIINTYVAYRIAGFIGCLVLLPLLCFLPTYGTVLVLLGMGAVILLWAIATVVVLLVDLIRYGL